MDRLLVKNIAIRIIYLVLFLVLSNYIYSNWFFEKDIQEYSPVINRVRSVPNDADIIYIGESSNTTFRDNDIDKRPISAMIADFFPKLNVYGITKEASHSGIYKILLSKIPKENTLKTLVVTLNLRSFNAQWIYSDLETPLQKSMVLLKPYPPLYNRFMLSFKAYDIKTNREREAQFKKQWVKAELVFPYKFPYKNVKEWDGGVYHSNILDSEGKKDYAKTELSCHFIKAYGFQIDTLTNPRIKDFNDIVELAKKRNWNLVFNLMAENTEKAEKLLGKDIIYLMKSNRELLKKYYTNKGVLVVDNLTLVKDEDYIDQDWTTEHYAERGRHIIAANVSKAISVFYKKYYKQIDYKSTYKTYFFNNCENSAIWNQSQTISSDFAYSGNKSSKIGKQDYYSITLEYPINAIPDSLKNEIIVNLMYKADNVNKDLKLVFEFHKKGANSITKYYDIEYKNNNWTKFSAICTITDDIKSYDLLKVYVLNKGSVITYIDDFEIVIN